MAALKTSHRNNRSAPFWIFVVNPSGTPRPGPEPGLVVAPARRRSTATFWDWQGSCDCQVGPACGLCCAPKPTNLWSARWPSCIIQGILKRRRKAGCGDWRHVERHLCRTIQILDIDILTEEERVRVFDVCDRAYPILARTLAARRDNLKGSPLPPWSSGSR